MTSTRSANAIGLPALRFTGLPELEGTALRLHVAPFITARWPSGDRGYALLSLCPGDDPDEPAALVRLPLAQADALAKACAAFNCIMDAAERAEELGHIGSAINAVAGKSAPHGLTPAPAMTGDFLSPGITMDSRANPQATQALEARGEPISSKRITTPAEPRAQALVTAAAQLVVLAGVLPAVMARCLGLL